MSTRFTKVSGYNMDYFIASISSLSYWRYALFSKAAASRILAVIGALWLFISLLNFFKIYTEDRYGAWALPLICVFAIVYVLVTRRPLTRIRYKIPKKDFSYEVKIGNLLDTPGEVIISSSTTFDTDMSGGLIATNSIQGQFALKFFQGKTDQIDAQIQKSLKGVPCEIHNDNIGKKQTYPIGTVAKVEAFGRNFYFVAMSEFNKSGTAQSSVRIIDQVLERLWTYMAERAELGDIVIPLIGTGRGRIELPRKKIIERIAQSFADASRDKTFSNKLIIVISPKDAAAFDINLFQIRDYLSQSLHV